MTYPELIEYWAERPSFLPAHTSGCTGSPKKILLPRKVVEESAMRTIRYFNLTKNTHFHSCISPEFIGGKMMAIRAIILNAGLTWETPSNQPVLISVDDCGNRHIPDFIAVVPSQLHGILSMMESDDLSDEEKEYIRTQSIFLCGGAPLGDLLASQVNTLGIRVYESYGMTETSSHIALRRAGDNYFFPLEGITIDVDSRRCLTISIEGLSEIVTNDVVEINARGGFRILGRYDNVIISGGKKIFPEEIEGLFASRFPNTGVLAYGKPDPLWGEALWLDIEIPSPQSQDDFGNSRATEKSINSKDLIARFRQIAESSLPPWLRPKGYRTVSRLSRTNNGKLKRSKG